MSALTESDRITLAEARTLANAQEREGLIDALSVCQSPTLAALGPQMEQATAHAAALGCCQALLSELADKVEALAAELDAASPRELVWCELVNAPAHEGRHAPQPNCRHPHNAGHEAPANPVPSRTVWRVNEDSQSAREMGTYPGPQADRQAADLNALGTRPAHIHYMAIPPGGMPFDYSEADRLAGVRS